MVTDTVAYSPEWDRLDTQITGPGEVYTWESSWTFGLVEDDSEAGG